jgi:hypothetical protein
MWRLKHTTISTLAPGQVASAFTPSGTRKGSTKGMPAFRSHARTVASRLPVTAMGRPSGNTAVATAVTTPVPSLAGSPETRRVS